MKLWRSISITAITLSAALAIPLRLAAQDSQDRNQSKFVTFDVPGAGTGSFQGTFAGTINPAGVVAGAYSDTGGVNHGFLRSPDGAITTFDAPGAGTGAGQGTFPVSNDISKSVTGYYLDASNVYHGFVRALDGTITTFDAPHAGAGTYQGTFPVAINPSGAIAGVYHDTDDVIHGFLRTPDGSFTEFDAPGADTSPGLGTIVAGVDGITPAGVIAGFYVDSSGVAHGYLRAPDGGFTTFDVSGAGTGPGQGTFNENIGATATTTGLYIDSGGALHAFLRTPKGAITKFDAPNAGTGAGQGTSAGGITPAGVIACAFWRRSTIMGPPAARVGPKGGPNVSLPLGRGLIGDSFRRDKGMETSRKGHVCKV